MIGYDDLQSLELKVRLKDFPKSFDFLLPLFSKINYAKEQRLGGIVIYPVNFDDSSGQSCNQGKFPMVSLVKRLTSNHTVSCEPPTTPPMNTTTAPKNRTKIITPKWKLPRPDYLGVGLPMNKHHRKTYSNSATIITSIFTPFVVYLVGLVSVRL